MHESPNFQFAYDEDLNAKMKVVGVGGAGGNGVDRMISTGLLGVEFLVVNTDLQALDRSLASKRFQIGKQLTKGLGAGADPIVGRNAAEQDKEIIAEALKDTDMVFITAGMGGGTGTGAAPVIAEIARELGILTVAIVTRPFLFEGRRRMNVAEEGITELRERVDTLVVIPNQRLMTEVEKNTSLLKAFEFADSILTQATKGISDLIAIPGIINLDFADVRTVMKDGGDAMMGIGVAVGENKGVQAATAAISSPLLEDVSIAGAQGVLVNITGSSEVPLNEVGEASEAIYETAGENANVILGAVIDDNVGEEIRVTVIATGFNNNKGGNNNRMKKPNQQQQERLRDYRPPKKEKMEIPAKIRREAMATDEKNGDNGYHKSRIYLGEIDLESDPPKGLPDFMQQNRN